jgi:hypothetical protein
MKTRARRLAILALVLAGASANGGGLIASTRARI